MIDMNFLDLPDDEPIFGTKLQYLQIFHQVLVLQNLGYHRITVLLDL